MTLDHHMRGSISSLILIVAVAATAPAAVGQTSRPADHRWCCPSFESPIPIGHLTLPEPLAFGPIVPAREVPARAVTAARLMKCPTCAGRGCVPVRVLVGYRYAPGLRTPIYETRTQDCAGCHAGGSADPDRYRLAMHTLIDRLSRVRRDDAGYAEMLAVLSRRFAEVIPAHNQAAVEGFNELARRQLADAETNATQSVWFIATVTQQTVVTGDPQLRIARVSGTSIFVMLTDLQYVDGAVDDHVLVGGVIAGQAVRTDGTPVPVVQGGFAVRLVR